MAIYRARWFYASKFLFEAVKLTKNADPKKYSYSLYGIGFVARRSFSLSDGKWLVKKVIIFGTDMNSSVYIDKISWFLVKAE